MTPYKGPITVLMQLMEISPSAVEVTVFPLISHIAMLEKCSISYVVQTDTDINCVYMEALDHFVCSDLNLYTEVYNFVVYELSQHGDDSITTRSALTMSGTKILGFGSCKLHLSDLQE